MRLHNSVIKGIAYYHPENQVGNDYFIEHFEKQGEDIRNYLAVTGSDLRYISDDVNETIVTMGINAVNKVLKKTNVKPSELNLIVFSTGTPEYLSPTNAMKIHNAISAGQKTAVYDVNANCVGMIVALDQVSRTMRDNPNIKYALIVGADQLNKYSRFNEPTVYSISGDAACAIVLENTQNTERGFIDSDFYTNSSNCDKILMPAKGLSSTIHDRKLQVKDKLVTWIPFNFDGAFYSAKISIEELLERNNLTKKDIKRYFISQFAKKSIEQVCNEMDEDINKFTFISNEFGYTGTTSPFLALARSIENEDIKSGDNIIFWSVGAGTTCACVLFTY
ncbi:ketoacyl-ACP synthase III [Clostridium sp. HBUAS56017]|uniref:ketoacyl-ACP synthase III n=1 Tax=Clostridium sp. HBUAS56017 TaxID=2571128 RepID=UPI00117880AB|nr:ketoacyl-ACP synthase III [Clostridium sp. HBUAS56017]